MDKAGLGNDSDGGSSNSNRGDVFLKHLNKNSHRISKPVRKPLPASPPVSILDPDLQNSGPQSQQPPVYNINKNDFRDVVQKLTGSPANERPVITPPSQVQSRGASSRLQRIRPPPLAQISNRPPMSQIIPTSASEASQQMLLPPLPSVHIAAESPISAYMRFLKSSNSLPTSAAPIGPRPHSSLPGGLPLPPLESSLSAYLRFLSPPQPSAPPQDTVIGPQQQQPLPPLPVSPLPFGCAPSPRSPYGIGPSFLLSPTGQLGLPPPLSPTLPLPNPR